MLKNATPNNFDCLRLVAAYLVLFSHQFSLVGLPAPTIGINSLGEIGVFIFFSISGYLVTQSWERDPSAWRFLAKRILRIFPALIVVTVATLLLLGPSVSTLSFKDYFLSPELWSFFGRLTHTAKFTLPGVFTENPYPNAVNGSLWTLPIELAWYSILLFLGVVGLLRHRFALLLGTIVLAIFVFVIHGAGHNIPHRKYILELGAFFCYGACLHYFRDFWTTRLKLVLLIFGLSSALLNTLGYQYPALFLLLPILIIAFGSASTPFIRQAGRFGDISYGLYIYAFPVQQTVIMLAGHRLSVWGTLLISTLITGVLALLSWHFVEHPALRLKRYFKERGSRSYVEEINQAA